MLYWTKYEGHEPNILGKIKRNKYDNNIYTFDIETTSYLIKDGLQYNAIDYLDFTKEEQEKTEFQATMYIWMFGINENVYYGRTWQELYLFLTKLEKYGTAEKKYVFVHNLSFEFQFLRNIFTFDEVFARKSRKVMKCTINEFNIEFRCTYYMTNIKLAKLPKIYGLKVNKLVGDLDYNKIRHSYTELSDTELSYCENDCLVLYEYLKKEMEIYKEIKNFPLTSTGKVRKEFKEFINKDYKIRNYNYQKKVRNAINTDGHIFNLLQDAFAGGYTHANWHLADEILKNVRSFDFTSSYPFVMVSEKYPSRKFKPTNRVKTKNDLLDCYAYLLKVTFKNIRCKYQNTFISQSKCSNIKNGRYDNGRVMIADEISIVITDVDFKFIEKTYTYESYKFEEVYFSVYEYLPKEYIEFVLQKYVNKTKFKNVEGKELEYALEKAKFNSLYGMSVTNNISDNVLFDNEMWQELALTNDEILDKLQKEEYKAFLSFSYRCLGNSVWKKESIRKFN